MTADFGNIFKSTGRQRIPKSRRNLVPILLFTLGTTKSELANRGGIGVPTGVSS